MSVAMVLGWGWVIVCFTIGAFRMLPMAGGLLLWWSIGCAMWILHAWASVQSTSASGSGALWMVATNALSLGLLLAVVATAAAREVARVRKGS